MKIHQLEAKLGPRVLLPPNVTREDKNPCDRCRHIAMVGSSPVIYGAEAIYRDDEMTEPMDKDELEKLKAVELASYVPPYTNAEIRELYRQALLKEPWWKRLWYKIGAADLDGRKTDGTGEDRYLPG
jgi:hypothetical protein